MLAGKKALLRCIAILKFVSENSVVQGQMYHKVVSLHEQVMLWEDEVSRK